MKINYISAAHDGLGSFRYHIKTPAIELKKLGHEVNITHDPLPDQDAYIFHKHLRDIERFYIKDVKKQYPKSTTYFIVSDYHLDNKHRNHYVDMVNRCDQLVVCTNLMRKTFKDELGKDSVVIKDPWGIEFNQEQPKFRNKKPLRVLWFGSTTNIDALMLELPNMDGHHIHVVTNLESGMYAWNNHKFEVIAYSPGRVKEWMSKCDVVVIPQQMDHKRKLVKTHNRMVDTIRMGRFAIASPIDAYKEFSEYAWIGNIKEGFDWLDKQSHEEIEKRIAAGQEYINKEFSPEHIGKQWENLLSSRLNGREHGNKG